MIIVGGITRLTESGLSIVKWQVVKGTFPPITSSQWERVFNLYQESPQYQTVNFGMTLSQFKVIFFWEYFHRLLGRVIGIVSLVLLFLAVFRKDMPLQKKWLLAVPFILVVFQGMLGWYMVKSGLVDIPRVSHFRLAAHLVLAFAIFVYILWIIFGFFSYDKRDNPISQKRVRLHLWAMTFFVGIQVVYGAFTAGLRAGYLLNTFPKMGTWWFPPTLFVFKPVWLNFLSNPITIQWIHRSVAWVLFFLALVFLAYLPSKKLNATQKKGVFFLISVVFLQFGLGIATLVLHIPILLATLHQGGALFLITVLTWNHYIFRFSKIEE